MTRVCHFITNGEATRCPICKSEDIEFVQFIKEIQDYTRTRWSGQLKYHCRECHSTQEFMEYIKPEAE